MRRITLLWALICMVSISICGCTPDKEGQKTSKPDAEEATGDKPLIKAVEYGAAFGGVNGCAVIYEKSDKIYKFYNEELCRTQASPWSTFKIAAALMGLHNQAVTSEESRLGYNQTVYPMEAWNQDLTLKEAFQQSCVWYFRKVIDSVGEEEVRGELEALNYGNRDSSQWGGSGVNPLPELNGFWLGASLKISPYEQVEMLRDIFEGRTIYSEDEVEILKNCMLTETVNHATVYGKTGTGQTEGWFVGAAEKENDVTYFAVYLNGGDAGRINGAEAKRIAMEILF